MPFPKSILETSFSTNSTASFLQLIVRPVGRRRQNLIRSRTGYGIAMLVDLHAQAQAHRRKNLLDLIQRLASEVLGLEHFGFSLLHEFTDGLNVRVLQAVVAAHGKLKLFHRTVQIFVMNL